MPTGIYGVPAPKSAEVRVDELMAAAETLFLAQGVEATTISELVEHAQVAKGTFYHYFESKSDMLAALAQRNTSSFLDRPRSSRWTHAPPTTGSRARMRESARTSKPARRPTARTTSSTRATVTTIARMPTRTRSSNGSARFSTAAHGPAPDAQQRTRRRRTNAVQSN